MAARKKPPAAAPDLVARRLTLVAADGSPRIELFVAPNGTPHLRMLNAKGTARVELELGGADDEEEDADGWDFHLSVNSDDPDETRPLLFLNLTDEMFCGHVRVAGQKLWDAEFDAASTAAAWKRGKR